MNTEFFNQKTPKEIDNLIAQNMEKELDDYADKQGLSSTRKIKRENESYGRKRIL